MFMHLIIEIQYTQGEIDKFTNIKNKGRFISQICKSKALKEN